jgi:hypothetical protein
VMRDGSSRFGPQSRFHNFAAAGVGWIFTKQNAVHDLLPALSFGKIRVSYGTAGNDQIGDYRYLALYNPVNVGVPYQGITALAPTNLPNPNLQWEQTTKLQVGVDLRILKDRLTVTANYSRNTSSNQLLNIEVPELAGSQVYEENLPATVRNTDIEFDVQAIAIRTNKLTYTVSFDFTRPKNQLVRYAGTGPLPSDLVVGGPLEITHVYLAGGVNKTSGLYQFKDSKGGLTTAPSTATDLLGVVNTSFPRYYGGVENSLSYGNIEFSIFFQLVGALAANLATGLPPGAGFTGVNQPHTVLGRWREPGNITNIERYGTGLASSFFEEQLSTAAYSNASFWRLKNVAFSWKLMALAHRLRMKELRFFVHGENLVTFTKFLGLDPQTGNSVLPPLRIVTGGVDFSI